MIMHEKTLRVTLIECDWKECFRASDINTALGQIGPHAVFYNVPDVGTTVDSNVLLVANASNMSVTLVNTIWAMGDLCLREQVFEGRDFKDLLRNISKYARNRMKED